jgi:hypothetical protein
MAARYDLFLHANADGKGASLVEKNDILLGVKGIHALAGRVLRMLLTTPGRWPGRPEEGTILANITGSNIDATALKADVLRSVAAVGDLIKRQQLAKAYPKSESLESLEVIDITFPTVDKAQVRILVTGVDGSQLLTGTILES